MRKALLLVTSAALVTGFGMAGPAAARYRADRVELSANQITSQADARTARMKVDLRLTPEQENNWSGFETAMHDIAKNRADRQIAVRDERTKQSGPIDFVEQMRKDADSRIERSNDWKKLADAAQPLYASLNDQQKRHFAESLSRADRERDIY